MDVIIQENLYLYVQHDVFTIQGAKADKVVGYPIKIGDYCKVESVIQQTIRDKEGKPVFHGYDNPHTTKGMGKKTGLTIRFNDPKNMKWRITVHRKSQEPTSLVVDTMYIVELILEGFLGLDPAE